MQAMVERNLIKSLFSAYNEEREKIVNATELLACIDRSVFEMAMTDRIISTSVNQVTTESIETLLNGERLLLLLDQKYWAKAFEISNARTVMPSARVAEWDLIIKNGEFPAFTIENVVATVFEFFSSSRKYMAEKVDGILNALSPNYKTNKSDQITEKFIFGNAISKDLQVADEQISAKIEDLRSLIKQIRGQQESTQNVSMRVDLMLQDLYNNYSGEWCYIDGNAFRIKVYKNGSAHIELNPEIVEEMCVLLSELYPMQIAHKKSFVELKKEFKNYRLTNELLSDQLCLLILTKLEAFKNPLIRFNGGKRLSAEKNKVKDEINLMVEEYPFNFSFKGLDFNQQPISQEFLDLLDKHQIAVRQYHDQECGDLIWFAANYDAIPFLKKISYQGF